MQIHLFNIRHTFSAFSLCSVCWLSNRNVTRVIKWANSLFNNAQKFFDESVELPGPTHGK